MEMKDGFLFNMNDCQTSVTGAEFLHMGKRIVKLGSRRRMLRKRRHRNRGYGSGHPKNKSYAVCRLRWKDGLAVQGPQRGIRC